MQDQVSTDVEATLQKSLAGAEAVARQYPQYADPIRRAARESFVKGADEAYLASIAAIVIGAGLVFFVYPRRDAERALFQQYAREDAATASSGRRPVRAGRPPGP